VTVRTAQEAREVRLDVGLLALLSVLALSRLVDVLWLIPDPGIDFGSFYQSAGEWTRGRSPYPLTGIDPPNLTPPAMLVAFAPFTVVPLPVARALWAVLSLFCIVLAVWLAGRELPMRSRDALVVVLASSSTALALGLGQVSLLLMLMMTLAWLATRRGQTVVGGAWLGAVCLLKPFYGLFLIWQLRNRDWRGAAALVGVFAGGLAVSVALVGPGGFVEWVTLVRRITWQAHIYNASAHGVAARLFSAAPDLPAATWTPVVESAGVRVAVEMLLMAVVVGLSLRVLQRTTSGDPQPCRSGAEAVAQVDELFTALGAAGILLSPLAWVHYLPVCAAPTLAVLARRDVRWGISVLVLAAWPYQWLVNRHYGLIGTLVAGQWSFALVMLILAATALGRRRVRDGTAAPRPHGPT
jgi:hypothetical protein